MIYRSRTSKFLFPDNWQIFPRIRPARNLCMYLCLLFMPASERVLVLPFGLWIKQAANIRNSPDALGDARSALVCPEGVERNKGRWETEPFPRRVHHLQRKLNDSAQFARTRSVRCNIRTRITGYRDLFFLGSIVPSLFHSAEILEREIREKLRALIEARSND